MYFYPQRRQYPMIYASLISRVISLRKRLFLFLPNSIATSTQSEHFLSIHIPNKAIKYNREIHDDIVCN